MRPVLSVENMRKSDAAAWSRVPSRELMYRAGRAVFECREWEYPAAIVCGSGNNAGDGYVIAGLMKDAGRECTVFMTSERLSEDGKFYHDLCVKKGVDIRTHSSQMDLSGFRTVFDCIFGTGFKGVPRGVYREAIEKINASGAYVVAVDIGSGLNGDSGMCELCADADITVSIGGLKSGLFMGCAKDHTGEIINADIGIDPVDDTYGLVEAEDLAAVFAPRRHFSNKGTYGYTALIGGSQAYSGAAKLANLAAAALRSGTGVVKLAVPESIAGGVMPYILESTLYTLPDRDGHIAFDKASIDGCLKRTKAVAVGMGIGMSPDTADVIRYILENYDGTAVIDADGLNVLAGIINVCGTDEAVGAAAVGTAGGAAGGTAGCGRQDILKEAKCSVVLTPHMKEFSRLSGMTVDEIQADPINAAKKFAGAHKCIVLLKGPATVITDGSRVLLTDRGCAGMATAGSGDVLSGILAAVCGYYREDLMMAVAAAAYVNGAAGEAAQEMKGDIGMIASDTVAMIPEVIKGIRSAARG